MSATGAYCSESLMPSARRAREVSAIGAATVPFATCTASDSVWPISE
ncbi:hypothetical protein [Herbiconiux sp. UC225_62]